MLSLEEMAIRKLVVHFWTQTDTLASIRKIPFENKFSKFILWEEKIESKVKDKVTKLGLPESLDRRMNLLVRPIGLQIPDWLNGMERHSCDSRENVDLHLLKHLCWTSAGTVDNAETAEKLVHLGTLDIMKRFDTACGYCLVNSLPVVWQQLPESYKSYFDATLLNTRLDRFGEKLVQIYWAYVLKGEENKLLERHSNFYSYAFVSSVRIGNKEATEYFFEKLNDNERDTFLYPNFHGELVRVLVPFELPSFPLETNPGVFCYLFSQLAPEVQMEVLREHPGCLFRVFMHWPWQDLFLDKTDLFWNCPPDVSVYENLHFHIRKKIVYSDYYFPELFGEFFRRSPVSFRKYFVNEECQQPNPLLSIFLYQQDKEGIRAVLRNIDAEDRFRLLSRSQVFDTLDFHLGWKESLMQLCVQESCPSREEREILKKTFMKLLPQNEKKKAKKTKWRRFFKSLDEADARCLNKRSLGDKTTPLKKRRKVLRE